MDLLRFLLRQAGGMLGLAVLSGLLAGFASVGLIALINAVLGGRSMPYGVDAVWAFAALSLLVVLMRAASSLWVMRLGQAAVFDLRAALSRRILGTPLVCLQQLGPARLLANLTDDVSAVADACRWIPLLCVDTAIVLGCLLYLAWLSLPLLGAALAAMALGVAGFRLPERRALRHLRAAREHGDTLYRHLRALGDGIKELKLHRERRAAFLDEQLDASAHACRRHYLSGMAGYVWANQWGNGVFYAMLGLTLFALPGWGLIAPELRFAGCVTLLYLLEPLGGLLESMPALGRAGIALGKIDALGTALHTGDNGNSGVPPSAATLEFLGVSHRFRREGENRDFVLGPLNLRLAPGEIVFLVGGNGSGKTTLALLLAGLYLPESGEIRLGGKVLNEAWLEDYRQHFAAVFSDFYLFESLLGFDKQELDSAALDYLRRLQLDHKVSVENGRFSTLDLSQGQRKRLALLVAYLDDRPFYLFDEWAADQDPAFKKIFYTEILPALKARNKGVLVISHDDAYFQLADRCLKLEDGQLRRYEYTALQAG